MLQISTYIPVQLSPGDARRQEDASFRVLGRQLLGWELRP